MVEESNGAPESQTLLQGLADLRQTWEHLARELAAGVPELPGVIEQELSGLTLPDLNEETLIRVTESVVARVADAGFPDEATALFRRMGRAMYELLLLLATQQEIRDLGANAPAVETAKPAPPPLAPLVVLAAPEPKPPEPPPAPDATPLEPTVAPLPIDSHPPKPAEPIVEKVIELPRPAKATPILPTASPTVVASPEPTAELAGASGRVPLVVESVFALEPRDPVRPARGGNGVRNRPSAQSKPAVIPASDPTPAGSPMPPSPRQPELASPDSGPLPEPAPHASSRPAAPEASQTKPSAPRPGAIPAPAARPSAPSVPTNGSRPPGQSASKPDPVDPGTVPAPSPTGPKRELTENAASLWGFDPAARESEVLDEPSAPPAPEPDAPVPAGVAGAPRVSIAETRLETRPEPTTKSGWAVRLSPRTNTERERKLAAREAQLPVLVGEIVAAAKTQQEALSARGNARRALAAARDKLPLADGNDPSGAIEAMLEAGQLEEAASMAVQMANTVGGEEAAAVACTVGEGVKQSKHVELAILCFTTAVLCCPPCDRACWQLCNLSVERRDTEMAPVWLEFVARLLRARGADPDAISVYRQLLKLTPRRTDIRELLRISSLTGVLPD
ncbi:MAG: hypothetical protein ACRENX_00490 [Candidatus Dormibacteria bacterium]